MANLKRLLCVKVGPKKDAYSIREATALFKSLAREIDLDGLEIRFNGIPDRAVGLRGPPAREMTDFVRQLRQSNSLSVIYLHGSSYLFTSLANDRLTGSFLELFDKVIVHKSGYEDMQSVMAHEGLSKTTESRLRKKKVWRYWAALEDCGTAIDDSGIEVLLENEPYFSTNMHYTHSVAEEHSCKKVFDIGHMMRSFYQTVERDPTMRADHLRWYSVRFEPGGWPIFNDVYIRALARSIVHCHIHGYSKQTSSDHVPLNAATITTPAHKELMARILQNAKALQSITIEVKRPYHNVGEISETFDYFERELLKHQV